jgi:hypothetical protein
MRWLKLDNKEPRPLHLILFRENGVLQWVTGGVANASGKLQRGSPNHNGERERL